MKIDSSGTQLYRNIDWCRGCGGYGTNSALNVCGACEGTGHMNTANNSPSAFNCLRADCPSCSTHSMERF